MKRKSGLQNKKNNLRINMWIAYTLLTIMKKKSNYLYLIYG